MKGRIGKAEWRGGLEDGDGEITLGSGELSADYSFGTRFEDESGTNPEELIGAALAGCFSMALAKMLDEAGTPPDQIRSQAKVTLGKTGDGFAITRIDLKTEAAVPEIADDEFQRLAESAKEGCPVGQALRAVDIRLQASLV